MGPLFCDMKIARQWTSNEKNFAVSVGDVLTLALEEDELLMGEHRYKSFFSNERQQCFYRFDNGFNRRF